MFITHSYSAEAIGGAAARPRSSRTAHSREFDNIFIERLWRSVKCEHIYLYDYETVTALAAGLGDYFQLNNYERPHQSLSYLTPAEVHFSQKGAARLWPGIPPYSPRFVFLTFGGAVLTFCLSLLATRSKLRKNLLFDCLIFFCCNQTSIKHFLQCL